MAGGCPASAATRVVATLELEDGAAAEPVELTLAEGSTYAGLVELDADPHLASAVTIALSSGTGHIDVHDLFVISYG